jgi:oligopeptide/dipeptide ABC transporter ATP-binding protein
MNDPHILQVDNLSVSVRRKEKQTLLLDAISFSIKSGEIFCLIGESGSGKTTLAYSLTRLFDERKDFKITGKVTIGEKEILGLPDTELSAIRKRIIRYIFQEPSESINPLKRIRSQMRNALRIDRDDDAGDDALFTLLKKAGIEDPKEVVNLYPHQLSIGMLQRIFFAMATGANPQLIIADEPTSAVDAALKFQLLDLLETHRIEKGMSVLLITHDFQIARRYADRIAILYKGKMIEIAQRGQLFSFQAHPYSKLLFGGSDISNIPDIMIPDTISTGHEGQIAGCCFYNRCERRQDDCILIDPPMEFIDPDHGVRCIHWK